MGKGFEGNNPSSRIVTQDIGLSQTQTISSDHRDLQAIKFTGLTVSCATSSGAVLTLNGDRIDVSGLTPINIVSDFFIRRFNLLQQKNFP